MLLEQRVSSARHGLQTGSCLLPHSHTGPSIGWRWPFVIVAVPAVLAAALMLLTTDDPPRGMSEQVLADQQQVRRGAQGALPAGCG
jgi:MFS family permease